jgi:hypothetical protein
MGAVAGWAPRNRVTKPSRPSSRGAGPARLGAMSRTECVAVVVAVATLVLATGVLVVVAQGLYVSGVALVP